MHQNWKSVVTRLGVIGLFALLPRTEAMPNKILLVDAGVGFPQLASLQATIYALPHFQVGLSYGILPGGDGLFPVATLPGTSATFADGLLYTITPTVKSTLFNICPYVRFFPGDRPAYIQFAWNFFTTRGNITSTLSFNGVTIPGVSIDGYVDLVQSLPTLSIGHIFASKFWHINLALGVTYVHTMTANAILGGAALDMVGGVEANQDKLDAVEAELANNAAQLSREYREKTKFTPSIMISIGIII